MTVQVPDMDSFNDLAAKYEQLQLEFEFLKSLMLGDRWLTRKEAMKALGCSHDKLWKLTKADALVHRYEGKTPFYCAFSIRTYLTVKNFNPVLIDKRLLAARYGTSLGKKPD